MVRSQRRTALFYDAPLSTPQDIALVKSMLLFFDDIAVFSTAPLDARLCAPLVDRGLLHFVAPRAETLSRTDVIVRATLHRAAMESADQWSAAVSAGDWDLDVPRIQGRFSRPALMASNESPAAPRGPGSSLQLFKLLAQDGWLLPDESTADDWIVTPGAVSVANSILAQAVRTAARDQGWLIEPVATRRDEAKVFTAILEDAVENVGAANVVMSEFPPVSLDLSRVGMEDIVDFCARHRSQFRAHLLALQALVAAPSTPSDLADRKAALVDEADRLLELQRRRWPTLRPSVSLGLVGATWSLGNGDLLGALIGAAGPQLLPAGPTPASAYTYILRADAGPDPRDTGAADQIEPAGAPDLHTPVRGELRSGRDSKSQPPPP